MRTAQRLYEGVELGSRGSVGLITYMALPALFLIGLELEPRLLWEMRARLLGLGGLQVGLTTLACLTGIGGGMIRDVLAGYLHDAAPAEIYTLTGDIVASFHGSEGDGLGDVIRPLGTDHFALGVPKADVDGKADAGRILFLENDGTIVNNMLGEDAGDQLGDLAPVAAHLGRR